MINPDFVQTLRCPLNPSEARLELVENALVCQSCQLRFPVREGIPCLLVTEAELPDGCRNLQQLPCQQAKARAKSS